MEISISVTDRCNARCEMCSIWQKPAKDINLSVFENIDFSFNKINITGGEPILNPDFKDIVLKIVKLQPQAKIIVLSNGLSPNKLKKEVSLIRDKAKNLGIGISLDSIDGKSLRNVPKANERQKRSVDKLKELKIKDIRTSTVITEGNYDQLLKIYKWTEDKNIDFAWNMIRNSELYYQKDNNKLLEPKADLIKIIEDLYQSQLKRFSLKSWLRAYSSYGFLYHLKNKKRILPCLAGEKYFFVDTEGILYPCELIDKPIGDLKKNNLSDLKKEIEKARKLVANCNKCWGCNLLDIYKKNPIKPASWVIKKKLGL